MKSKLQIDGILNIHGTSTHDTKNIIYHTSGGRSDDKEEGTWELLASGEPNKSSKASIAAVKRLAFTINFVLHHMDMVIYGYIH